MSRGRRDVLMSLTIFQVFESITVRLLVFSLLTKMSPVSLAAAGPASASSTSAAAPAREHAWRAEGPMSSRHLGWQARRRHRAEAHWLGLGELRVHVDTGDARLGAGVRRHRRRLGRMRLGPARVGCGLLATGRLVL